jgi:hypothetical protein
MEITKSNFELQKYESWLLSTMGEKMFSNQTRNSCAKSGLHEVFMVIDHHGANEIQFQALEEQERGGSCFRPNYAYEYNDLFEGKDWLRDFSKVIDQHGANKNQFRDLEVQKHNY